MTRSYIYWVTLTVFLAASAMTLVSILRPRWISFEVHSQNSPNTYSQHMGLHTYCNTAITPTPSNPHPRICRHFPDQALDCPAGDRYFCIMWRTVGFLMSLATVAELASLVGFIVVLGGGKMKREKGWRVLGVLIGAVAGAQFCALAIVAYLIEHDEKFIVPGWSLDSSFTLCTVSASLTAVCAGGLALSAALLPPEDGYEFLEDPIDV